MARPRFINPDGNTRKLSVMVSDDLAEELAREAKTMSISLGEVMRRRLAGSKKSKAWWKS